VKTKEVTRLSDRRKRVETQSVCFSRILQSPLTKLWQIILLLAAVGVFTVYGTVLVAQKGALREVDRKFLDDLAQKQDGSTHSTLVQNSDPAAAIEISRPSVPRAELVVNCAVVRRGELVVHTGTAKRKHQSITTSLRRSQIPKDL
jgi:hypothetical protein